MNTCTNEETCKEEASWMHNPYEKGWVYMTPSSYNGWTTVGHAIPPHLVKGIFAVNSWPTADKEVAGEKLGLLDRIELKLRSWL